MFRPQFEHEEDYYVQFQQKMADTIVRFSGGEIRKAKKRPSPNESTGNNWPELTTESCTLHEKIIAKYVRYKDEVNINNNNKPHYGDLYAKRAPSSIYSDPTDLQTDLQPTVMGLRRIHGTTRPVDTYHGSTMKKERNYQHHLTPIRQKSKQTKMKHKYDEPEIELFSSKSLRRTKGSILSSPRSHRLLGKTRDGYNASQVRSSYPFE